jgi:SPP1 family predicted phage head-tail adaptor
MSYTAQELNTRIQLQRFEDAGTDPLSGLPIQEWVTYGEAFAKVEPLVGREYIAAGAEREQIPLKVTMRYRPDVRPADRVLVNGETFDIESAQNIKFRNRELLLYVNRIE